MKTPVGTITEKSIMSNQLTVAKAKWLLAAVWVGGAGALLVILASQSMTGAFNTRSDEAWKWFLPSVMPALSLIIGVLVVDFHASDRETAAKRVPKPLFWLAAGFSVFYLALIAAAIVLPRFMRLMPLDVMQTSESWLVPLQGLAIALLAAFFRSR